MTSKAFKLRVITPEKILVDDDVCTLTFPGLDGLYGVLPGHAPLMTALAPGELRARRPNGDEVMLFVSDGFAQVANNVVRLVCDAGETAMEIDPDRAQHAETRARERLAESGRKQSGIDAVRAHAALLRALVRQKISRKRLGR